MNGLNVRGAAWVPDLRPVGRLRARLPSWLAQDAIVFCTAMLAPVALAVAAVRRQPLELLGVLVLSAMALAAQTALPRLARDDGSAVHRSPPRPPERCARLCRRAHRDRRRRTVSAACPVRARRGGCGRDRGARGAFTALVAVAIYLVPEVSAQGASTSIGERGITLAGVAVILAFGTHRMTSPPCAA